MTFHLEPLPPRPVTRINWVKLPNGNWKSGNVQLRLVRTDLIGDYPCEQWGIWIRSEGRWFQCHCKSRKWLYGSPGQAKRGITKVTEFIFGNPLKDAT